MLFFRPIRFSTRAAAFWAAIAMIVFPAAPTAGAAVLGGATGTVATAPGPVSPQQGRPAAINGFQYGDPTAGIDLIQPPQPDSFGDAQVSLPITLPPGRNGLQPQPSISYDSSSGDGWLGMGWDFNANAIPNTGFGDDTPADSISVDTRWGVPRYDPNKETETYLLGSVQLTPTAHTQTPLARQPERVFTKRVEGDFLHIIRHGDSPSTYWWEVIDKYSDHFFYGGEPCLASTCTTAGQPDPSAELTDQNGNAYWWGLTLMEDNNGNATSYFYNKSQDTGIGGGNESGALAGQQIYLSRINYTGFLTPGDGLPRYGAYDINLITDAQLSEPRRPDVMIDARGGGLHVTAQLLREINITYCPQRTDPLSANCASTPQTVRTYWLNYKTGPFDKSLLESVGEAGTDGKIFATHTFHYYDDVQNSSGAYQGFASPTTWDTGSDNVGQSLLGQSASSALGESKSLGGDGRLYLGFDLPESSKEPSAGAGVQLAGSSGQTQVMSIDINGDGLPDKVFLQGNTVYYRLNQSAQDPNQPFSGQTETASGLHSLGSTSDFSVGASVEGYAAASVFFGKSWTFSNQPAYFADVNGDGLPDLVDDGHVLFNHHGPNGSIYFSPDSSDTAVPISQQAINAAVAPDLSGVASQEAGKFPVQDTLRRWVAPYAGTISITAPVHLDAAEPAGDGVRVAIQHNGQELWSQLIGPSDTAVYNPTGVSSIPVAAGDRIYFRVGPLANGAGDLVDWNPQIDYVNKAAQLDVNGLDIWHYKASQDFTLAGRPGTFVAMPYSGAVTVSGTVDKTATTSDDVTFEVLKNGAVIYSQPIASTFVGSQPVSTTFNVNAASGSTPADRISVKLAVDSPINVNAVTVEGAQLKYDSATDSSGQPISDVSHLTFTPTASTDIYPLTDQTAPQQSFSFAQSGSQQVDGSLSASGLDSSWLPARVVFTVKTTNALVAKQVITITAANEANPIPVSVSFNAQANTPYWYDFTFDDPRVATHVTTLPTTAGRHWSGVSLHPDNPDVFPEPYRGWAYGGYNPSSGREYQAVNESALLLQSSSFPGGGQNPPSNPTSFDDPNYSNPLNSGGYPYVPAHDPATGADVWLGPKPPIQNVDQGAILGAAAQMSASLLGPDQLGDPKPNQLIPAGSTAPTILGNGTQDTVSGGVVVGASAGWGNDTGQLDYLDLNGDGYPDVVGNGVIYTTPTGGYQTNAGGQVDVSHPAGFGSPVRSGLTFGYSLGIDGTPVSLSASPSGHAETPEEAGRPSSPTDKAGHGGSGQGPGKAASGTRGKAGGGSTGTASGGKNGVTAGAHRAGAARKGSPPPKNGESSEMQVGANLGLSGDLEQTSSNDPSKIYPPDIEPNDVVQTELMDLNGDGLPDLITVHKSGEMDVSWNLGYSFSKPAVYISAGAAVEQGSGDTKSLGIGLGFSIPPSEFSGGLSLTENTENQNTTWVDLNGDGLPDRLDTHADGQVTVQINNGTGLDQPITYGQFQNQRIAQDQTVGLGGGADFTEGIGPLCYPTDLCYIIVNPGFHVEQNDSATTQTLEDLNGDGYPDSVTSTSDSSMSVAANRYGRTNLLESVQEPLGGSFTLDYTRTGNTIAYPLSAWSLSKVTVSQGQPDDGPNQVTTYSYDGRTFGFAEREDLGNATVIERQLNSDGTVLRSIERTYDTDNYYERGLLTKETVYDGDVGNGGTPKTSTVNTYNLVDVTPDAAGDPTSGAAGDPTSPTSSEFPQLADTQETWYAADGSVGTATDTTYQYDTDGNLIAITDRGELGDPTDNVTAQIGYTICDVASGIPDLKLPASMLVTSNGTTLLRRVAEHTCTTGNPSRIDTYDVPSGDAASTAVTDYQFDPATGMITGIEGPGAPPANASDVGTPADGRYQVQYTYDSQGLGQLVQTSDSYGLTTTYTYNPLFGALTSVTDPNGAKTTYTYDPQGRLTAVTGPLEQGTGHATVSYEYHPDATVPYAIAHNYDPTHPNDPIDWVEFVDGLGRVVQTKQDATIFAGAGSTATNEMVVSGGTMFDALGRAVTTYYSTTEPLGTPGTFNTSEASMPSTVTTYSALDRVTSVTAPGNRTTTYQYGFGAGPFSQPMFTVHETEPGGRQTLTYSDVRGNVVGVDQLHKDASGTEHDLFTRYDYDPLARLTKITDPTGAATTIGYDLISRVTSVDSPNTGDTQYAYDPASNLIAKITGNLAAQGKSVTYTYDQTRLTGIQYPDNPSNNATYTYGAAGAPGNAAGLLTTIDDGARTETRSYDLLGQLIDQTDTMKSVTHPPDTFETKFQYDTWGRPLSITYPDGEVVSYGYDSGGRPDSVQGAKGGFTYQYVNRLEYDKFGHAVYMAYGNGVDDLKSYDPLTTWLSEQAVTNGPTTFENLHYTYDPAGNPLTRDDTSPSPASNHMGGPSTQSFTYDDLYRLVSATGSYTTPTDHTRQYTDALSFDSAGRLATKAQTDTVDGRPQKETTYSQAYAYQLPPTYAPSHIGDRTYTYDADGNLTGWTDDTTGQWRTVTYDEASRTTSIADNGSTTYRYNSDNQLAILRDNGEEVEYPNQYYTSDSTGVAWKQIYVGTARIAIQRVLANAQEKDRYFLTADRTGSTNLVTDAGGDLYEHLEYFPSGEIWVWEKGNTNPVPYLFDGKLFDDSREVSLFNRRDYEPRDQIMYAPDPVLTQDPALTVDAPGLLDAHSFAFDNPLAYTDTSGQTPQWVAGQKTVPAGAAQPAPPAASAQPPTPAGSAPGTPAAPSTAQPPSTAQRINTIAERITGTPAYKSLAEPPELVSLEIGLDGSFKLDAVGVNLVEGSLARRRAPKP